MNVVFKIDSLFPLTMVIELDDDLLGPLKNLTYSLLDKLKSILLAFSSKEKLIAKLSPTSTGFLFTETSIF